MAGLCSMLTVVERRHFLVPAFKLLQEFNVSRVQNYFSEVVCKVTAWLIV